MELNFKEWLINESSFVSERKKQIYSICKKYFGKAVNLVKSPGELDMTFDYGSKIIEFTWQWRDDVIKKETLQISFSDYDMAMDDKFKPSSKDQGTPFQTNVKLQPGSIDFARKLKELVKEIQQLGVNITYSTWGRRNDVYAKFLAKQGFTRVNAQKTTADYWWLAKN